MITSTPFSRVHQQGAALVVSLILLLVMTLLGVASLNTTTLQERMASNTQEHGRAFQAAESGLTQAVLVMLPSVTLQTLISTPPSSGSKMLNNDSSGTTKAGALISANFVDSGPVPAGSGAESNLGSGYAAYYFRIQSTGGNIMTAGGNGLANATGTNNNAQVVLNQGTWRPGASLNSN